MIISFLVSDPFSGHDICIFWQLPLFQASKSIRIPQTAELGVVRVVPDILVLRMLDIRKTNWRTPTLTNMWKLATKISSRKRTLRITTANPFPESTSGFNHIPGAKSIALEAKPSVSFTVPSSTGLYKSSIPVRQSCMTDTDSHSWSSSVARASSTNNAAESKSSCLCSPRVRPCRTMGVSPSHLSSRTVLPPSLGVGLSSASSSSETDGDDSTDALGWQCPQTRLPRPMSQGA